MLNCFAEKNKKSATTQLAVSFGEEQFRGGKTIVKTLTVLLQTVVLMSVSMAANLKLPSEERSAPVAVGEMAPDFTLEDQSHNTIKLSDARGKTPVVLIFYRGYW